MKYGNPDDFVPINRNAPIGSKAINAYGYVIVKVAPGSRKWALEHRIVMQGIVGRTLESDESVHHKNGDRQDNSPENLELWSTAQPKGQRLSDKLQWARAFLARYTDTQLPFN